MSKKEKIGRNYKIEEPMPFPEVPRVTYAKNPLMKVLCQLRFPPILKIDSEIPVNFQDKVRNDYPFYQEKSLNEPPAEIKGQLPTEFVKRMFGNGSKRYEFTSADKQWTVTLTKEFLALTAHDYKRWEEFTDHFELPLNIFIDEYSPSFYSRIGLRYQNVIRKSILGLQDAKWSELLKPYIAGVLAAPDVEEEFVKEVAHSEVIGLQNGHSQVKIVHRFGPP